MFVGVRCPSCKEVFNVSKRAFGKSIKCPACGQMFRVPAKKRAAEEDAASEGPREEANVATLRVAKRQEARRRKCPSCGRKLAADERTCPACQGDLRGAEPLTAVFTAKKGPRQTTKKSNPGRYYEEGVSEGLDFWKANRGLSIRLALFAAIATVLFLFCVMVALWTVKPGMRYLALFCGAVILLSPMGMAWTLQTAIIGATIRKKNRLEDFRFDPLLGAFHGLMLALWFLDVAAPAHLLAGACLVLYWSGLPLALPAAGAVELFALLFASLLFPLATSHMAMPVPTRGWLVHKMWRAFSRTFPAILHWCALLYLTLVPTMACAAAGAFFCGRGVAQLVEASAENSKIDAIKLQVESLPIWAELTAEQLEYKNKAPADLPWHLLVIPGCLLLASQVSFAWTAVFLMRANGLYTRHFADQLDLEMTVAETSYLPTGLSIDEIKGAERVTWKAVFICLVATTGIGTLFGLALAAATGTSLLIGTTIGLCFAGFLLLIGSYFTLLMEAFGDNTFWFLAMIVGLACLAVAARIGMRVMVASAVVAAASGNFSNFLLFAWGASTLGPLAAFSYGVIHWSELKYPAIVLLGGYLTAALGFVACMMLSLS